MDHFENHRDEEYLIRGFLQLELLKRMWNDIRVQCYNDSEMPLDKELADGSAFLVGPTSRHQFAECNWRCQAVNYLRNGGFKGIIYVPEPRGLKQKAGDFTDKGYAHRWESTRLLSAVKVAAWIPRDSGELLGLNTNLELGIFLGKLLYAKEKLEFFVGWPPEAERMGLPNHYAVELAKCRRYETLIELCQAVAAKV